MQAAKKLALGSEQPSVAGTVTTARLNTALVDRYRCPESYAVYGLRGGMSRGEGYFCFGPDTICYGETSSISSRDVTSRLHDVMGDVASEDSLFAFDPSTVIDNLRLERYPQSAGGLGNLNPDAAQSSFKKLVRYTYYLVRPCLPIGIRRYLQRTSLRGWKKLRFPSWPVDRTVEQILERCLLLSMKSRGIEKIPFIWFWPEGCSSCLIMTHDVETRHGLDFCPALMDIDNSFRIKSSFQVIPEGRYSPPRSTLDSIRSRGFEVNVHDLNHDGHLFRDRSQFLNRASRINDYARQFEAKGFRSAVLFRNLEWYDALAFSYDMSVPNVGHLDPQLGGCCTVMPYFIGNILELPLTTIQDYSLFHILGDYSIDLWKKQTTLIREKSGLMSFNIHPDYIMSKRARNVYLELLAYLSDMCRDEKVWNALPNEVDSWWRQRSQMTLVERNGTWCIEGEAKERARIGWATLAGEGLSYSLC